MNRQNAGLQCAFWSPPPDPEKPRCPYQRRFTVSITEHVPPPPFGRPEYAPGDWPYEPMLKEITQTKLVMTCPPLDSKTQSGHRETARPPRQATLTITDTLAVGNDRGPQLAVCSITPIGEPGSRPFVAVAKIFDPLYYSFTLTKHEPADVAFSAEVDYCSEAAAYDHLTRQCQAGHLTGAMRSFVPAYYGAWTFTLDILYEGVQRQRKVRLLLIEHLEGVCLSDLCREASCALRYDKSYRLGVLARILDGYARLKHAGVEHNDLAARNVMLLPGPLEIPRPQPIPRVVLIDYNAAVVYDISKEGRSEFQEHKLPPSPMFLFWDFSLDKENFGYWVPEEWNYNPRARQEWLLEEFGGEKAEMYEPPPRKLEFRHPNW
ncbi:hypothetical protein VTI74DRAFT_8852 [Chaetomium olivicolor]